MSDNNQTPKSDGLSYDTKTLITVLTLIFVYPVGMVLMFVWMKWRVWVKLLIAFPLTLIFLAFFGAFAVGFLAVLNPRGQILKANCVKACGSANNTTCVQECLNKLTITPVQSE